MLRLHPLSLWNGTAPSLGTPAGEESPPLAQVDESQWPLLLVRFTGPATEREFERYLALRTTYLERKEPHVVVLDTRGIDMVSPRLRQRYSEWVRDNGPALHRWVLGTAYVIVSPVVVMMMSVIRHCAGLTTPFVVTATLPPAAEWAAGLLQEAGMTQAATRLRAHYALPAS